MAIAVNQPSPGHPVVATTERLTDLLTALAGAVDTSRAVAVAELQERWVQARLRVLLVGEAKRGKSTVGNAILRRQVLPTGVLPLTAVATTVRAGTPERIEISHHDGGVSTAAVGDLDRFVTETGNPGNERGVDHVIVYLDSPLPHPCMELVDTPGVGSIHQHNTTTAETAMRTMDVAVFVLTMDPPISAAEYDLLTKVHGLSARTYVVLNKVDQLEPADRGAAERFTRRVVADALGTDPADVEVFPVCARAAVRAAAGDDTAGGESSGMAAFARTLEQHLQTSWRDDLSLSIAGSARRLVTELLDENALARRARTMRSAEQSLRVAAFREHLDGLDARRDDAAAAGQAHLSRLRSALDTDAAAVIAPASRAIRSALDTRLATSPALSTRELETAGWAAMTDLVMDAVGTWRATWSTRLSEAAVEAARRQQHLLDEAIADIRAAAAELLGVDLTATAPRLVLPDLGTFRFDVTPEIGWNQPVTSAVRRRIPGSVGRARMRRYLNDEAARLVDQHIGRARSDFQSRLEQLARDLRTAADQAYTRRQAQLREVLDAAVRDQVEQPNTDQTDNRLTALAWQLDQLLHQH